jgi:hypothetical protein
MEVAIWIEILGGNARRPMALAGVTVRVTDGDGTNSVEIDMLVTADAITEAPSVGWDLFSAETGKSGVRVGRSR